MATEIAAVLPETGVWEADSAHSSVRFKVTNIAVTTYVGTFDEFRGSFDAAAGTIEGRMKVDSIQATGPMRDALLGEQFFEAEKFPEVTFSSTSIATDGDKLEVTGDLTIKGTTRSVSGSGTFGGPVSVVMGEAKMDHLGVDLQLEIDRRDFGLDFNFELPNGALNLGWSVAVEFALDFVHKAPAG